MKWILDILRRFYLQGNAKERASPNDWIKPEDIIYYETTRTLAIKLSPEVWVTGVSDTNSMDGLIDYGHSVILTTAFDKSKLSVGDIVCFQVYTQLILHRLVEVYEDSSGRVYRTRGDNCVDIDPYYLRDVNLKYLCVGILY